MLIVVLHSEEKCEYLMKSHVGCLWYLPLTLQIYMGDMCSGAIGGKTGLTWILQNRNRRQPRHTGDPDDVQLLKLLLLGKNCIFLGAVIHFQFSLKVVPVWKFEGFRMMKAIPKYSKLF